MTSKTHTITGCGVSAIICTGFSMPLIPIVAGAFLGSLLPDIDHPKSSINQRILIFKNKLALQVTFLLLGVASFLYGPTVLKMIGVFLVFTALSAHRKFTHSLIGLFAFSGICYSLIYFYNGNIKTIVIGLIIGYTVHIISDCLSNHGIELLYPFSDKHFAIPIVSTGGLSEAIFLIVIIALIASVLKGLNFNINNIITFRN